MVEPGAVAQMIQVSKHYSGREQPAVDKLSLQIHAGEIFSLLGPNGAGKTTTVKLLAGLVLPSVGDVFVMGIDMRRQRTRGTRHIGAVLEGARNLYWRLSARENLRYWGSLRLVPRHELESRIDRLLGVLDLAQHQDQEVRTFSRGMQQKLAIAAALLHDPAVLLLDEPTLGLDVAAARQLEESVLHLAHDEGRAVLLTTHTMALAERLSDRILVMREGRQVASDTTGQILRQVDFYHNLVQVRVDGLLPTMLDLEEFTKTYPQIGVEVSGSQTLLLWTEPAQDRLLQLLQFLDTNGIQIVDVSRRQPTLEDAFLHLTGREQP